MTVALLERKPAAAGNQAMPGLRLMVLARIACEEGATRPELARELGPYVGTGPAARLPIETESGPTRPGRPRHRKPVALHRLARGGRTPAGRAIDQGLPRTWTELRDIRLVSKALGIERDPPSRLKGLARPDMLRAEILIQVFGLE